MIIELNIMNFAIMENISINFTEGFNVLTGETGTGKSIVVEGLNMVLGDRASKEMVKTGCDKASIEGLFYIDGRKDLIDKLGKYGIEHDESGYLLITRDIYASGRSVSRINGRTTTLSMLNDITKKLVDIHSQHEHQSLLNTKNHISLIDSFSRDKIASILEEISDKYRLLKEKERELNSLNLDEVERDRNLDLYDYQLKEMSEIDLESYDEEATFNTYNKLSNIKIIENNLLTISNIFKGEGQFEKNILDQLREVDRNFKEIIDYDDNLKDYSSRLEDIFYDLNELANEIFNYAARMDIDQEEYQILEERIEFIEDLKRKYGPRLEDVISYKKKIEEEMTRLRNNDKIISSIKSDILMIESELLKLSEEASLIRQDAAKILTDRIMTELKELNMKDVKFKIDFSRKEKLSEDGYDDIEFLISTNLGEGLKPLSKVVSGGEMSRIMLAFKSVFADYDNIETLIFDEIDTGISGMTAQLVGEKIKKIAANHQVICISHLPQIASMADSHFLIEKVNLDRETQSFVKKLSYDERVLELSRLLGGANLTEATKVHAKEMLDMR